MRILLTNDDGILSPGLTSLAAIAHALSDDVWTVAPETDQSGTSHSVTLHEPVRIRETGPRSFAVRGTPTDCVALAIKHVLGDHPPDLVLSGINNGQNLADDVTYSGTIAAAMEGTVLGVKSMALSLARGFRGKDDMRWETAEHFGPGTVETLLAQPWPDNVLWNLNFPDAEIGDVSRFEITRQGRRDVNNLYVDARLDARGTPYYWFGFDRQLSNPPEGTDLRAIYDGRISATPLHLDLTQFDLVAKMGPQLDGPPPGRTRSVD